MNTSFGKTSAMFSAQKGIASHGITPANAVLKNGAAQRFFKSAAATDANKEHDQIVKQTQNWVAQTFFGAMLKQMRESPFKSEMFDGGRGGEAFSSMYDQKLAEKMSRGAGKKLVNSIVQKIENGRAKQKAAAAAVQPAAAPKNNSNTNRQNAHPNLQQKQPSKNPNAHWRANLHPDQIERLTTGQNHVAATR